jgi:hypothetical protein
VSFHEVPPFDVLAGARLPYGGFGPILRDHQIEERLVVVEAEASRRISDVFGMDVSMGPDRVASLDKVIQQMWRTGWNPERGDVNLFARDFGSVLFLTLHRELNGELLFRSVTDLSHASVWWSSAAIEAFPFHKTYKALLESHGEGLRFYCNALKAKVASGGTP